MNFSRRTLQFALACTLAAPVPASFAAPQTPAPKTGAPDKVMGLPANWDGVWRGSVEVVSPTRPKLTATMELRIAKIGAAGAKTWTIQYSGQAPRRYEIRPHPGGAGRLILDEKSGVLLDSFLDGQTLFTAFSVENSLLQSRFELRGSTIAVEISTFAFPARSGAGGAPISYEFQSIQRGVLQRSK